MGEDLVGKGRCAACGYENKQVARFCANCGKNLGAQVAVTAAPAAVAAPQYSADGKWWWDGQKWAAVASAPTPIAALPSASQKKRMGWGRRLALAASVTLLVLVGILWATGEFSPATHNITGAADSGLGPGPYYEHFNCGGDRSCMTTGSNELTAKGGNTGIFLDYPDLASCQQALTKFPGTFNKEWCSTSKNPADTGA